MKQIFKFYVEISYVFIDTTLRIWYVGKEKQGFNSLIGVYVYNLVSKSRLMPSQTNKQKKKSSSNFKWTFKQVGEEGEVRRTNKCP